MAKQPSQTKVKKKEKKNISNAIAHVNSSFNNRIWRVDIGASKAFGEIDTGLRKVHVLVIEDDTKFHIVKEN